MNLIKNIVIVDDNRSMLKQASRILLDAQINVAGLFTNGQALLDYIEEGKTLDLVLLDVMMPDMDGFETLRKLRTIENEKRLSPVPVIFLTGEETDVLEMEALDLGASDYIKKPFSSEILIRRINKVLAEHSKLENLEEKASKDGLTGLLNKTESQRKMATMCKAHNGALVIFDLDNFKLVNDLYGHDKGDKLLARFADLLRKNLRKKDLIGRIGGDEFLVFLVGVSNDEYLSDIVKRLNDGLLQETKKIIGDENHINIGVSAGAAVIKAGDDYNEAFLDADKALNSIKANGKHSCRIWGLGSSLKERNEIRSSFQTINKTFEERNAVRGACIMDRDAFINTYRYMLRFIKRSEIHSFKMLISANIKDSDNVDMHSLQEALESFLKDTIRCSDLVCRYMGNKYFILFPGVSVVNADKIIKRINKGWNTKEYSGFVQLDFDVEDIAVDAGGRQQRRKS